MNIAIIGIGGVGGYYGGKLALKYAGPGDHRILFVARGEHLNKIKKEGLRLITEEGDFTARPYLATDDPAKLGLLDVVIFCVKGYGLLGAARMIKNNIHKETVVIPLLNGVDNPEKLKAELGHDRGIILNGCVYISTHIEKPGVVRQTGGSCKLIFGPEKGPSEPFTEIGTVLKNANINAVLSDNIAVDVWSKYLFVGPIGSITSMLALPFGAIMENDDHKKMLEEMMREVKMIAYAKGVSLPEDIIERSMGIASGFSYNTKSSLQLDFEKKKKTEVETFTGYVVKSGKELGVKTPLHDRVYSELIKRTL